MPFERLGNVALYTHEELKKYAEWEKSRQLGKLKLSKRALQALQAFGVGEEGGTAQGRRFAGAGVNVHPVGSKAIVQFIINEPLTVFAMTPEQAVAVGKELLEAGQNAQRINSQTQPTSPDLTGYEVVQDNADMKIMRKVQ